MVSNMGGITVFDQLTFASPKEKEEFEKYKRLKGVYLHKQVYDILLEANGGGVTYHELSSIIRYDKNLRDTLYIYLATIEEQLRVLLLDNFDLKPNTPKFKQRPSTQTLCEALLPKQDYELSELYFKLQADFKVLMETCVEKKVVSISEDVMSLVKQLRNDVMHHHLLIFGGAHNLKEAKDNLASFERKINALITLLPNEYVMGFQNDITKLNGALHQQYLTKFYLEVQNGRIRVCK
jgi:hypothetical protein